MGLFSWLRPRRRGPDGHQWLAMILRREGHPPIMDGLDQVHREGFPEGPKLQPCQSDAKDMWSARYGSGTVTVAHMRSRIPDADLERSALLSWHWPEAARIAGQHRSHLIVFVDGVGRTPMENARALTTLCSSLVHQSAGVAVFWAAASLLNEPERFHQVAREVSDGGVPPMLWFSLAGSQDADGDKTVTTMGLEPFGLHDVELRTHAMKLPEALEKVGDVGMYLLREGPVFQDGDTFGYSATDKTTVRITTSRVLGGKTMFVLEGR